jgi:hypothetical protein
MTPLLLWFACVTLAVHSDGQTITSESSSVSFYRQPCLPVNWSKSHNQTFCRKSNDLVTSVTLDLDHSKYIVYLFNDGSIVLRQLLRKTLHFKSFLDVVCDFQFLHKPKRKFGSIQLSKDTFMILTTASPLPSSFPRLSCLDKLIF